jgi:hypothetical protein
MAEITLVSNTQTEFRIPVDVAKGSLLLKELIEEDPGALRAACAVAPSFLGGCHIKIWYTALSLTGLCHPRAPRCGCRRRCRFHGADSSARGW